CPTCRQLVNIQVPRCPHCGRRNPGLWGYARTVQSLGTDLGFLPFVTWGCLGLYALTLVVNIPGIRPTGGMDIMAPDGSSLFLFGATGAIPIFALGRWWTLLSAAWLHGGLLHVGFNLAWIRFLAPAVARFYGGSRLYLIYTLSAIASSGLTSIVGAFFPDIPILSLILGNVLGGGASFSIGASGGLFGLFGAIITYGQRTRDPSLTQTVLIWAALGFVLGLLFPGVDNWGHLGGFLGGFLVTKLPWFDPERKLGHKDFLIAIACAVGSILSVLFSPIHALLLPLLLSL
ncbi:MAG: rhomboid family intramembrane serine protease, partial [Spirulinaceae cyanobacterium RM2_2_10]|nr:rhomboid family intramembrane serine protease [Spirulinaceae cyanobacterium RM2_2_10]